jgi:hypothetical protein
MTIKACVAALRLHPDVTAVDEILSEKINAIIGSTGLPKV